MTVSADDQLKARSELIVNTFFTLASNRPKNFGTQVFYAKDELDELLTHYEEDLKEITAVVDAEHLTRMAQMMYIFKTKDFEGLLQRIEDHLNRKKDQLDIYQVTNALRSFTHTQENRMNGKDKTFYNMEPKVLKSLDEISDRDFSHLLYAYGVRNVGNPELLKAFDRQIDLRVDTMTDYPTLFNVIYYLLFKENANKHLWQRVITTTLKIEAVLPIIYYRPFKAAKYYLNGKFPELETDEDFIDFQHKFWYPERYYNAISQERYLHDHNEDYFKFKGFLNARCFLYPISFQTLHNLFTLHYVFNDQKIAINYHLSKLVPWEKQMEPTEMQKIPGKVLKQHGWEVLDITEAYFKDRTLHQRIDLIQGWVREAK